MTNQEFEEYADNRRSFGLDNRPNTWISVETPCADNDRVCNLRWVEAVGDCCQIKKAPLWGFFYYKHIRKKYNKIIDFNQNVIYTTINNYVDHKFTQL